MQCILYFGQYKIEPYSPPRVSMTSLPKFFTSVPMCHPNPLFPVTHWLLSHGDHVSSSLFAHQTMWLIIISHLLIIIPGSHSLACLHDDKITHYTNKTLLNFIKIYFSIHCYIVSILSLYFHVHILCALCKASSI